MTACIYARFSSTAQREESIEGQTRECNSFAQHKGYTVVKIYADRAISGKSAENRPEFMQMIADSKQKLFDTVIVWKIDRFSRDKYDSVYYKNILKKNGVSVISATEPIDDSPEGQLMESIFEGFSVYYIKDLSMKVSRGMTENALKTKFNGGNYTFGYLIDENKHFQPDPLTAPVVVEVFQKYADGMTMQGIADYLKSKNIRTTKGNEVNFNRVQHMLSNRRYLGEYQFKDTIIPNAFEPIVPQHLFDEGQRRIESNKKGASKHKAKQLYLLTDKLFCGRCGEKMVGESGRGKKGVTYYYYKCANAKRRICDKKSVKKQLIEDIVIHETMQMLQDEPLIERIVDTIFEMQSQNSTMLPLLKKQLAETEKAIENMLNAIQSGIFTESTKQRLEELEQSKKETEVAMLQEKIDRPTLTQEQIKFWITKWREVDTDSEKERKKLIDVFVNAVYHYDNELVIMFNHKDGDKMITLDEVGEKRTEQADGACSDTVENGSPRQKPLYSRFFRLYGGFSHS